MSDQDLSQVLLYLNQYTPYDLALPGNWSPKIWYQDLYEFPPLSIQIFVDGMIKAHREKITYPEFFKLTRGYSMTMTPNQKLLWGIFSEGSLLIYFEELFIKLLQTYQEEGFEILLKYLRALGSAPPTKWDDILEGFGACCYQFVNKEPELYIRLFNRQSADKLEDMTDQELLQELGSKLSTTPYPGKISIQDSRSELLRLVKDSVCG